MSACFAYGLAAGDPIQQITVRHGTAPLWQGPPSGAGGGSGRRIHHQFRVVSAPAFAEPWIQYFRQQRPGCGPLVRDRIFRSAHGAATADLAATEPVVRPPILSNYLFCSVVGTTWDLQFFFHSMGETPMGKFKFSSRTLHMASIIIFSTLRGIGLKEWSGTSGRTKLRDTSAPCRWSAPPWWSDTATISAQRTDRGYLTCDCVL